MRLWVLAAIALTLCGCTKPGSGALDDVFPGSRGRYAGVGLYPAGTIWAQLAGADTSKDPAAARIADDEQVIVVIDSRTGELRQCGNFSGHCIGMNPWSSPLPPGQTAPAALLKHAEDLSREQAADEAAAPKATRAYAHRGAPAPTPAEP
jgi:hypothetical protein